MKLFLQIKLLGFIGLVLFFLSCVAQKPDISKNGMHPIYSEIEQSEDLNRALSLQNTFRNVSSIVLPVVVLVEAIEISTEENSPSINPFRFFFGPGEENETESDDNLKEYRNSGLGSGIIVKNIGSKYYVLTNNHVAGNADEIKITLYNDISFTAELTGKDERKDLALLMFETDEQLDVAVLGDSDNLYVGDFVLAVGSPFGFQSTVTSGIISALGRREGPDNNISDFIQTDAAINQGNSGGALVNLSGEVIGINTWITTPTGGSIGLGFSVPINNAKKTINDIIDSGESQYGWLGVSIGNVSEDIAENLNLNSTDGAIVSQVFKNSPAHKGGIEVGDIILSIDDEITKNRDELLYLVGDISPGRRVVFRLIRNETEIDISVTIEKRLSEEEVQNLSYTVTWPGINVFPLNSEIRTNLSLDDNDKGVVVVEVLPKTFGQIAGLKPGDLITEINSTPINNLNDFYRLLNNSENISFTVKRENDILVLTLEN